MLIAEYLIFHTVFYALTKDNNAKAKDRERLLFRRQTDPTQLLCLCSALSICILLNKKNRPSFNSFNNNVCIIW